MLSGSFLRIFRAGAFTVPCLFVASLLAGCGGSSKPVSLTVTASASTVDPTDTATLTASVENDKNSDGVTWSVSGGGTLSDTTTTGATYTAPAATASSQTATITATSVADSTKTATATITVPPAPSITTGALAAVTVGTQFSDTLAASGGIPPYSWTLSSGTLPSCLNITSAGVISGTPTASCVGTSNLTFMVTDSGKPTALTATEQLSLTITAAPAIVLPAPATLAAAVFNSAYSGSVAATGGAGALTYTLTGSLPTGLSLNPATGAITGTPSAGGTFAFTIKAADAFGDSATQAYSITVTYPAISVTTVSPLPVGYAGTAYSQQLAATGGAGSPYTWSVTSGASSLTATGLSLSSSGIVSGTTPIAGTASFTAQAKDSAGNTGSATISVTIDAGVSVTTVSPLPIGYAGVAYSKQLSATGGAGSPYTWTVTSGTSSLTALGLSVSSSGLVSGTTPLAGTATFTTQAKDSDGNVGSATISVTIDAGVTITTPSPLSTGIVGAAYSQQLAAIGGAGTPYTWSITSGATSLTALGLSLSNSGLLAGATPVAGTATFTAQAKDSVGNIASATFSVTIDAGVAITTASPLPTGYVGAAYSDQLAAAGGAGAPYTFTVTSGAGSLTAVGLSVSSSGLLSGATPVAGTASFTVQAKDGSGNTGSATLSITIDAGVTIKSASPLPAGYGGTSYSQQLAASGGAGTPYTWTVTSGSSSLTAVGLNLSATGLLSGTTPVAGTASFTAQAKDSAGNTASMTFSVTINAGVTITTKSPLPAGIVGTAYSQALTATGGTGTPYTWSVTSGASSLSAAGLALSSSGVISGATPVAGSASFTAQAKDSAGNTASVTFSVTIDAGVSVTNASPLPVGYVGTAYSDQLTAAGGIGTPYTFAVTSGSTSLTAVGLSVSSAGVLSGATPIAGTASFTVQAKDGSGDTGSATLSITIDAGVTITTASPLPAGYGGTSYSQQLAASGGAGTPYTWSVTSGTTSLTAVGLNLSAAGVLSGTTPVAGTASFTAQAKDSVGNTASMTFSVTINAGVTITTKSPLPAGIVGTAYSQALTATGGTGTPYTWSVTSGASSLSAVGLALSSSGVISGATPVAGSASFTAQAKDSAGNTGSVAFSVIIDAGVSITTSPLPVGVVGVAYSQTLAASGGIGTPYTWTVTAGSTNLTAIGLSLSSAGVLSGTTPVAGTAAFTVQAKDSAGNTGSASFSVTINSGVTVTTTNPLPTGYVGVAYSDQLTAGGGAGAPYTWTVTSGASSLTAVGLSVSTSGLVSGATPVTGTASFTVQAKDGSGNTGSATLSVTVNAGVTITTKSPLTTGIVGTAYSDQLAASGGSGTPYTWTVTAGSTSLTAIGLSVSSGGLVSGATPVAGTASFTVQAKDSVGNTASTTFSVTIDSTISITTASPLPTGVVGTAYSQTFAASGGAGTPYTWTVTVGTSNLTNVGLSLSSAGVLSGTTPIAGTASFTLQAKDSSGNTASANFSVTIDTKVTVTTASPLPTGIVGTAYSQTLAASGGTGTPYTWTVTSGGTSLTAVGLNLSSAGVLSGATPIAGTASFTVQAKDSAGNTGTATLSVTVDAKVTITTGSPLPSGVVGTAYSQTLAATGGTGTPYTWTVTTGTSSLTAVGLSLSTGGVLSGATPIAGTATFTAQAKDSAGNTGTANFSVTVNASLTITTTSLPYGTVGIAYSQQLASVGGTGGNVWSVSAGSTQLTSLGLSLSSTGLLSGTTPIAGTANFTAQVKDSASDTATQTLTVNIYTSLSLTPASLPGGTVGLAYSAIISGAGGSGSYCYIVPTVLTQASTLDGLSTPVPNSSSCGGYTAPAGYGFYIGSSMPISGTPSSGPTPPYTISLSTTLIDLTIGNSINRAYSIAVTAPPALSLPTPNPGSLPSATVNQNYNGSVTAIGGAGSYTWTVNGSALTSGSVSLGNGTLAVSANGNALSVSGTPNTVTNGTPISFTASVADTAGQSTSTDTYTIAVNNLSTISGQINFNNSCGNNGNMPAMTVSINTTPVQTTTTDGNGNYAFSNIPNGTYTITPSITGPESVFYPATLSVTVNNNPLTGENFGAVLGYTVSGNISYSGTATGQTYVVLNSQSCTSGNGTSLTESALTSGGAFTIRGVQPGNYSLRAWMDTTGQGSQNAADPSGNASSNISVSTANVTGASVTMTTPTVSVPTSGPSLQNITPTNLGVAISFNAIKNSGVEAVQSYTVQWSTSSAFTSPSSATFDAAGTNSNVWILNSSTPGITGTFLNGTPYYFRARGNVTAGSGPFSTWGGGTPKAVTIGAPSGTGYYTISGTITVPSSITPTGPLYVGVYNQNTGAIFATRIASPSASNAYTVSALADSNPDYFLFAVLDQNNNGLIDVGDVSNTNNNNSAGLAVTGNLTGQDVTLPSANSTVSVTTQYIKQTNQNGTYSQYSLNFDVREGNELPVSVTLMSGPNVIHPIDMGSNCQGCGTPQWQYYMNISPVVPVVGQAYTFLVAYSNGTTETLTGTITGVLTASNLATNMLPDSTGASITPTFTWTDPANASSYIYQFSIGPASGGNYIWQIPGNNSNLNGFSSTITSITWGIDPTGGGSTPTQSTLTSGTQYNWNIGVQDVNGNEATAGVQFTTSGTAPLTLPTPDPSSLGPAIVGQTYSGAINANGGVPNYTWTVNGTTVTPNGSTQVSIGDGLSVFNNGNNTLDVTGTPTSPQTVSFTASITDSTNTTDTNGTLTYTINIGSASPLTLPDPSTNTGSALIGYPYGASLQASGGSGSGYVFTLNGTTLPSNGTLVSIGDGLSAFNNGGSNFNVSGTPTTATTVSFTLSVTDSASDTDTGGTLTYTIAVNSLPSGANNSNLTGRYVCESGGFTDSDGTLWASLSSFQANGSGSLTSGVFDTNGTDFPSAVSGTVTGTYSIGSDNNGIVTLTSVPTSGPNVISKWAVALTNAVEPAQEFRMVEIDDLGSSPSGRQGQADCFLATTSAFASSTISGHNFVFLADGQDGSGAPRTTIGSYATLSGNITAGVFDQADGIPATVTHTTLTGGSYTTPNSTTGRFTSTTTGSFGSSNFAVYIIDSSRMFVLNIDASNGLWVGNVRTQQQASYSAANLNGNMVFYFQGFDASGGAFSGYNSSVFQASGNGAGSFTINESYSDNSGNYSVGNSNGTYPLTFDPTYPGRVTFVPGGGTGYLYMYNNNAAGTMVVDGSGDLLAGFVDPQTQTTFTDAALAGNYMIGGFPPLNEKDVSVGEIDLSGTGTFTGSASTGGQNAFTWDDPETGITYSWLSTTYGSFSSNDNGNPNNTCIVTSATKFVCTKNSSSTPGIMIFQQ